MKQLGAPSIGKPDNGDFERIEQRIDGQSVVVRVTKRRHIMGPYNAYLTKMRVPATFVLMSSRPPPLANTFTNM